MSDSIITFDLDSCLADTSHRHGMIDRENGTDWDAYSQACIDDTPVEGVLALVRILVESGHEVHALSGRKVSALPHTLDWFAKHNIPIEYVWLDETSTGTYTSDLEHALYKLGRAREVEAALGKKIALHVDDWAYVSKVFNENGIPCVCVRTPYEIEDIIENGSPLR